MDELRLLLQATIARALAEGARGALSVEQRAAVDEIVYGVGRLLDDEVEGLATAAHERHRLPFDHPPPALLAKANGFDVVCEPELRRAGLYVAKRIYHRPHASRRALGWTLYHELAHALLDGRDCTHADVQRVALALTAPRALVVSLLRRHTPAAARRTLVAANGHAPAVFLRLRVERVLLAAEQA